MTTGFLVLLFMACCAMFACGVVTGRLTAGKRGALSRGSADSAGPPHKDLWFARPVWFPWKGQWRRGRITEPSDPSRHFYSVRSYDTTGVPGAIRVAHLDLRVDTGEPLLEMCPSMSIVEFEDEMAREARRSQS